MEEKIYCTHCGQEMSKNDKVCPNCKAATMKDKNILAIIGIAISSICVLLFILYTLDLFKSFDPEGYIGGIGFFGFLIGSAICVYSIDKWKKYKHNYKIAVYVMLFVNIAAFSVPFITRIIDAASDPCMCSELNTTIEWDAPSQYDEAVNE